MPAGCLKVQQLEQDNYGDRSHLGRHEVVALGRTGSIPADHPNDPEEAGQTEHESWIKSLAVSGRTL